MMKLIIAVSAASLLVLLPLSTATSNSEGDAPVWWVLKDTDTGPGNYAIKQVGNCGVYYQKPPCNVTMLKEACLATLGCEGFNTDGWLKTCVNASCGAAVTPNNAVDTYGLFGSPYSPNSPPPAVGDWHYPEEEEVERNSLKVPLVSSIDLSGQTAVLALGGVNVSVKVGDSFQNWTLQAVFQDTASQSLAVLELNFARWGLFVFRAPSGFSLTLRKSVGRLEGLQQPTRNLSGWYPNYNAGIYNNATDLIRAYALRETDEPEYTTFNKYMAPSRDYSIIGTFDSTMKWTVCITGRIKRANDSLYEVESDLAEPPAGEIIFDPKDYAGYWPTVNFTDLKSGLVGGGLRIVSVAAWNARENNGIEMTTFANPNQSGVAQVLVRLRNAHSAPGSFQYYGAEPTTKPISAADYYSAMLAYYRQVSQAYDEPAAMTVRLPFAERRQVDMVHGGMLQGLTAYVGLLPNYGTGFDYWSVEVTRGSSLPLTTLAMVNTLLEWGRMRLATDRLQFYFENFVRDDGTIDMQNWSNCPFPVGSGKQFNDGLADYGRVLSMWYQAVAFSGNATFTQATLPRFKAMATFLLSLHTNATSSIPQSSPVYGMIYGPAEHDTCHDQAYYINVQVWTICGLRYAGMFLQASDPALAKTLTAAAEQMSGQLPIALKSSTQFGPDGKPFFVSPKLGVNMTAFHTMIESVLAEYSNFRYWTEALLAAELPDDYALALMNFRETHLGTVSGITRWNDHLDDMPSAGYGLSALQYRRFDFFNTLHYGHMANYHSPGTFHATEQLGMSTPSLAPFRAYLSNTNAREERDVDFCVPSTMLPSLFTKWQLVFAPLNSPLQIDLALAAPRRWYTLDGFGVRSSPTLYGTIDFDVVAKDETTVVMNATFTRSGDVNPNISVTLKGLLQAQELSSATLSGQASWVQQKPSSNMVILKTTCAAGTPCPFTVTGTLTQAP